REQRRKKVEFPGKVRQVLQDVERKYGIESALARRRCQVVLGVAELERKLLLFSATPRKPHGYAVHIVVRGRMAAPRQLQNDFSVPGAVVQARALRQLQRLHVGADSLVLQVVAGDGKQVELGVFAVPRGESLAIIGRERGGLPALCKLL